MAAIPSRPTLRTWTPILTRADAGDSASPPTTTSTSDRRIRVAVDSSA